MTLKVRFSLSFIGHTLLVVGLFGAAYYVLERNLALESQREEEIKTAEKVASVCRPIYLASSVIVALNYINVLKKDPSIASVSCLDLQGRILADLDPQRIGHNINEFGDSKEMQSSVISRLSIPVMAGGNKIGVALVGYNQEFLRDKINLRLWAVLRKLMMVAAFTFLLALLVGLALAWGLSQPISRLIEAARRIGAGNLDYQTPIIDNQDELGYLAREINDMARRLKELDELKDLFVSCVSHDLRVPMAAITMNVDYMLYEQGKDIDPKHRVILQAIRESSTQLSIYASNILDTAKIKANRMEYKLQSVLLDITARKVIALFEIMGLNHKVGLAVEIPAGLPPAWTDPDRLEQALANLVSNALKFTPSGGKVTIGAKALLNRVEISVSDTGMGIAQESLSKLFVPFNQLRVDEQKHKRLLGTGLGLFIVKQTIDAMGASVRVESKLRAGTRFTISLPAAESKAHV